MTTEFKTCPLSSEPIRIAGAYDCPTRVMVNNFGESEMIISTEERPEASAFLLKAGEREVFVMSPGQELFAKSDERSGCVGVSSTPCLPIGPRGPMKVWVTRDGGGADTAHLWDTEPFLQKGAAGDEFWASKHSFLGEYDASEWPWPMQLPKRGECAVFTVEFTSIKINKRNEK